MIDGNRVLHSLSQTAAGAEDSSGKTPLDAAIELMESSTPSVRAEVARALSDWLRPDNSVTEFKLARTLIRRTNIGSQPLAAAYQRLLSSPIIQNDPLRRVVISLSLMDLGFPRTIASLNADAPLRSEHPMEWLTLIIANRTYPEALTSFTSTIRDNLISPKQYCLKAEQIRQAFGAKLPDFLSKTIIEFQKPEQKYLFDYCLKAYGYDLSSALPVNSEASASFDPNAKIEKARSTEPRQSWWTAQTHIVVESAFSESQAA